MVRSSAKFIGGSVLVIVVIGIVFLVGMRKKSPPVLRAVRRMNRAFWNPRAMETAGTPGAYASVIRHVGRTSGRPYETPVGAVATDAGFVIALPYGTQADWLKNVLAYGSATIVDEGETHAVDHPEVVPLTVTAAAFPSSDQRSLRLFGVDQCLQVRRVAPDQATEAVADPA
jgi:deazaflavin-dependent oxidoreductase (nitroreductase family)